MHLKEKLDPLEKKIKILRFIDHFGLNDYFNIDKVGDIELTNSYESVSTGKYYNSIKGKFHLSYTYNKGNNQINKVKFSTKYSSYESYENRYKPDIECDTSLNVTNTDDQYYIDKDNHNIPCMLYINGDEVESESWGYLVGKIIDIICGDKRALCQFLDFK